MPDAKIVPFRAASAHVDDLPCLLNPVQACDLKQILLMTPAERRLAVAMAFSGLVSYRDLFERIGVMVDPTWSRWIQGKHRLPFGVAFRLGKVFGVSAELLLEWWV